MSSSKTDPNRHAEMSPDEREKEHARRLHAELDAVLKRNRNQDQPGNTAEEKPDE